MKHRANAKPETPALNAHACLLLLQVWNTSFWWSPWIRMEQPRRRTGKIVRTAFCCPATSSMRDGANMKTKEEKCQHLPQPSPRRASQTALVTYCAFIQQRTQAQAFADLQSKSTRPPNTPPPLGRASFFSRFGADFQVFFKFEHHSFPKMLLLTLSKYAWHLSVWHWEWWSRGKKPSRQWSNGSIWEKMTQHFMKLVSEGSRRPNSIGPHPRWLNSGLRWGTKVIKAVAQRQCHLVNS